MERNYTYSFSIEHLVRFLEVLLRLVTNAIVDQLQLTKLQATVHLTNTQGHDDDNDTESEGARKTR